MATSDKGKGKNLTSSLNLFQQEHDFSTYGDIIAWLVDGRCRHIFPKLNPRQYICSRLNMTEQNLSLIMKNERPISLSDFCLVATLCHAPEAYDFLKQLNFPEIK